MRLPRVPILLTALTTFPLAACVDEPSTAESSAALIGGLELGEANGLDHPLSQVVELLDPVPRPDGTFNICTATRVGQRHLLTAAHCLSTFVPGAPLQVGNGTTPRLIGEFVSHVPLTLTQDGVIPGHGDLHHADVAMITLDARHQGFGSLEQLERNVAHSSVDDGHLMWQMLEAGGGEVPVLLVGYGCNQRGGTGAGRLRFGPANLVEPPPALAHLDRQNYFLTEGLEPLDGDPLTETGTSLCLGDSGGPVFFTGGVAGVNSAFLGDHVFNKISIPDQDWTGRLIASPVIDVISRTPAGLDPTLERAGQVATIYPDIPGEDVLYVKGYALDGVEWSIAGAPVPAQSIELLPRDAQADELNLDTVKITFRPDAPHRRGPLVARLAGEAELASSSATIVDVEIARDTAWRRYTVYRALACGDHYRSVTATCADTPPGMTAVTIVRSSVFETTVDGAPVRLERIEDTGRTGAYPGTTIANTVPRTALELGRYELATTSCAPNGACATIFIDFQYRDEQLVEQAGARCRYRSRRFYDIVPWVDLLGERLELTELMEDVLLQFQPAGFELGDEQVVDGALGACDAVLTGHPPPRPFQVDADGTIVPSPGWAPI